MYVPVPADTEARELRGESSTAFDLIRFAFAYFRPFLTALDSTGSYSPATRITGARQELQVDSEEPNSKIMSHGVPDAPEPDRLLRYEAAVESS